MNKNDYKDHMGDLLSKNARLQEENTKLRIALCNLRDEYLDIGGDPNQLELFDTDNPTQLKIFESPDGGKTIYEREAGDYESIRKKVNG
tara:strand:- start:422 stop:688 length:267 start_codon:yes stop_codon:yes gene_type:complete